MSRLIEVESLIDRSISVLCGGGNEEMAVLVEDIEATPTIDLVRCKECKFNYGNEHNCEYNPEDIVCTYWASDGLRADDFCSYGEREGE